jgi:DNA replication protein DnaC
LYKHLRRLEEETPEQRAEREAESAAQRAKEEAARQELRRRKLLAAIAKDLGPRYSPDRATLENFQTDLPKQVAVKNRVLEIVARLPEMISSGQGIIFYGPVGTGKDHLLAALLYSAAGSRFTCKHLDGQDFYGEMRDRMDGGQKEEEILSHYSRFQVLSISDPVPPANDLSPFRLELLYRLVNRRYRALRPTWMTLNAKSPEQAENYLSSQVWDRLQESAELFHCCWPSFREKNVRKGMRVVRSETA